MSLKFVSTGPIDNKSALIKVIVSHRTRNEPLLEPIIPQFIDANARHSVTRLHDKYLKHYNIFQEYFKNNAKEIRNSFLCE